MESFGWNVAPAATPSQLNFPPCFWSSRQKEAGERSCGQPVVAGDYGGGIAGADVDLAEAFLISSSGIRYGSVKTGEPTELGGVKGTEMGVGLPPLPQPESMSSSSAAEVRQPREAAPWPAAAELSTTGTAGRPWRDALTALDHIGGHFGLTVDDDDGDDGDDDDEVSAILPNCDTIANRRSCGENVSSGESENDVCGTHGEEKRLHRRRSNVVGEVVSRASSNPDAIRPVISQLPRKRKEAGRDESAAEEAGRLYRNVDLQSAGSSATDGGGGGGGFRIFFDSGQSKSKKSARPPRSSSIDFRSADDNGYEPDGEAIAQVKEMIYRAAAMRPVTLGAAEAAVEKPKRKNVKISSDPQTVAARHRRERISERLRVLQRLVPGGSKMDTASMLDEAANYLKFLKSQVRALGAQGVAAGSAAASTSPCTYLRPPAPSASPFNPVSFPLQNLHTQIQTLLQKRVLDRPPHHLHI